MSQTEARCFRLYLDIRIFEFCFTTLKSWTFLSRHWHHFSLDTISCETSHERVNEWFLTPTQQFFRYIMARRYCEDYLIVYCVNDWMTCIVFQTFWVLVVYTTIFSYLCSKETAITCDILEIYLPEIESKVWASE